MGLCYWKKCHCPDKSPNAACPEHGGFNCGMFEGKVIAALQDVNDEHTRRMQDALDASEKELTKSEERVKALEDLEKQRKQAEDDARNANNAATPDPQAVDRANAAIKSIDTQLKVIRDKLIAGRTLLDPSNLLDLLLRPYVEQGCACVAEKVSALGTMHGQLTTLEDEAAEKMAEYDKYWGLMKLGGKALMSSIATSIVALAALYLWTAVALPLTILAFLLLATGIVACQRAASAQSAYLQKMKELLALILAYYRVQNVTTCRVPVHSTHEHR